MTTSGKIVNQHLFYSILLVLVNKNKTVYTIRRAWLFKEWASCEACRNALNLFEKSKRITLQNRQKPYAS